MDEMRIAGIEKIVVAEIVVAALELVVTEKKIVVVELELVVLEVGIVVIEKLEKQIDEQDLIYPDEK